jgi:cell division inhibitor SulA
MPKYVIERELPGAGKLSSEDLRGIAAKSCDVLRDLGPEIHWIQSYVTSDKIYCVYVAPDEALVREHAERGGFPVNRVEQVSTMIDPDTAVIPTTAAISA